MTVQLVEGIESMWVTLTRDGHPAQMVDLVLHCQRQGGAQDKSPTYRFSLNGAQQLIQALTISVRSAEDQAPIETGAGQPHH